MKMKDPDSQKKKILMAMKSENIYKENQPKVSDLDILNQLPESARQDRHGTVAPMIRPADENRTEKMSNKQNQLEPMESEPPEVDLMAGGSIKFTEGIDDDQSSVTASKHEVGQSQRHINLATHGESSIMKSQIDNT